MKLLVKVFVQVVLVLSLRKDYYRAIVKSRNQNLVVILSPDKGCVTLVPISVQEIELIIVCRPARELDKQLIFVRDRFSHLS